MFRLQCNKKEEGSLLLLLQHFTNVTGKNKQTWEQAITSFPLKINIINVAWFALQVFSPKAAAFHWPLLWDTDRQHREHFWQGAAQLSQTHSYVGSILATRTTALVRFWEPWGLIDESPGPGRKGGRKGAKKKVTSASGCLPKIVFYPYGLEKCYTSPWHRAFLDNRMLEPSLDNSKQADTITQARESRLCHHTKSRLNQKHSNLILLT